MKTVILNDTKNGVEVYDVNSNEILDMMSEIFEICPTDTLNMKKEYKWFKEKHNHKNIYIYWLLNGITFGVLDKSLEVMTASEKNDYIQSVIDRTQVIKAIDYLTFGPEAMYERREA